MKTITSFAGLKKGQKFKVIACTNGHNYQIGKVYTLSKAGITSSGMTDCAVGYSGNTLPARDIQLCSPTIVEMHKEIDQLYNEITTLEAKIAFCKESESEEYDENTFKVYNALKIINSLGSDMDKSKAIANMLNAA